MSPDSVLMGKHNRCPPVCAGASNLFWKQECLSLVPTPALYVFLCMGVMLKEASSVSSHEIGWGRRPLEQNSSPSDTLGLVILAGKAKSLSPFFSREASVYVLKRAQAWSLTVLWILSQHCVPLGKWTHLSMPQSPFLETGVALFFIHLLSKFNDLAEKHLVQVGIE